MSLGFFNPAFRPLCQPDSSQLGYRTSRCENLGSTLPSMVCSSDFTTQCAYEWVEPTTRLFLSGLLGVLLGSKQASPSIGVASLSLVAVPWLPAMCQQGISREPPGSGAYSNNVCSKQQTTARSASLVIKGFLKIKTNNCFQFVSGRVRVLTQ